ncbi:MAG: prepilin peptidase [Bariatricus sp.]
MSIYEDQVILIYFCVLAAVLGAVLGSFLNCTAFRIAHGESFTKGHSRCPNCGHELGVKDLFPIISWVLLGGKCRYCKNKISVRYPITEAVFSVLTVLCLLKWNLSVLCLRNLVFLCCLFCLTLVDLESYIIPDGCLLISAGAWVAAIPFSFVEYGGWSGIALHLLAAVVYGGGLLLLSLLMDHLLKKESLGGGDIKLFAVMGLYLGMISSLFALLLACILGLVLAGIRRKSEEEGGALIPFGPAIAAASWFMLLYGTPLVEWYIGLI